MIPKAQAVIGLFFKDGIGLKLKSWQNLRKVSRRGTVELQGLLHVTGFKTYIIQSTK